MPIAINPICRKPRVNIKLNNRYLRSFTEDLLNTKKNAAIQWQNKSKEANVMLPGGQRDIEKRINLDILSRINIRKSHKEVK